MTLEEAAEALNGRQYLKELPDGFEKQLKDAGLVAVFGASDDLMEFRGAIHDEIGAWSGATAYLDDGGLLENKCGQDDCPYFEASRETARTIEALWDPGEDMSWAYNTDIPHATFLINEDDEIYCRGIVFRLADATRKEQAHGN